MRIDRFPIWVVLVAGALIVPVACTVVMRFGSSIGNVIPLIVLISYPPISAMTVSPSSLTVSSISSTSASRTF